MGGQDQAHPALEEGRPLARSHREGTRRGDRPALVAASAGALVAAGALRTSRPRLPQQRERPPSHGAAGPRRSPGDCAGARVLVRDAMRTRTRSPADAGRVAREQQEAMRRRLTTRGASGASSPVLAGTGSRGSPGTLESPRTPCSAPALPRPTAPTESSGGRDLPSSRCEPLARLPPLPMSSESAAHDRCPCGPPAGHRAVRFSAYCHTCPARRSGRASQRPSARP